MSEFFLYRVLGKRAYRGHEPGTEFPARLETNAERRAIMRGSIERIGTVVLRPEKYKFPRGWLEPEESPDHGGRREAPSSLKGA